LRKEDKSPNKATGALSASVQNEPTAAASTAAEPLIVQNEATDVPKPLGVMNLPAELIQSVSSPVNKLAAAVDATVAQCFHRKLKHAG
jgi:hypothetical protein